MHAHDFDAYDEAHDFDDAHDLRMAVMDRLLDYAPAGATNLDGCLEAAPRSSSQARDALPPRQPSENPDERRAAHALYGTRSADVSPATPRRLRHSFCHCCINDAAPGAGTPEAA